MARIRTIKPEFWTDGTIIALPYEVRLFYIGMWNQACDRGHLPDDPMGLKLRILPVDPVDGAEMIGQLIEAGRVQRVQIPDGRWFLSIPRFTDHQRVDARWNSRCPVCAQGDSLELTETHASLRDLVPGEEGKGREGKGEESADAPPSPYCSKHPKGTESPCGPCGTARNRHERFLKAEKNKPTPIPKPVAMCTDHAGYPLPCHRCELEALEVAS